jgi:hypothetical protein
MFWITGKSNSGTNAHFLVANTIWSMIGAYFGASKGALEVVFAKAKNVGTPTAQRFPWSEGHEE